MQLTEWETRYLLGLIANAGVPHVGYSKDPQVAQLQAKLSVWLQVLTTNSNAR